MWNLWHGCRKFSEGCAHCYMFRHDGEHGLDSENVYKTSSFYLPRAKDRKGVYKIPSGSTVWTCFTSDFFIEEADEWRKEAWNMIKERPDLHFVFVTKRIHRTLECFPDDWGGGYSNVSIICTVESQRQAEIRLPIFKNVPVRHKGIICEPLLEPINLRPWLGDWVEQVTVGGESGPDARPCDFEWVIGIRKDCIAADVPFHFKQTGANFVKDGKLYRIPRWLQMEQARKAGMNTDK